MAKVKQGVCPKCGKELSYEGGEVAEGLYSYQVECSKCDFTGYEEYELKFKGILDSETDKYHGVKGRTKRRKDIVVVGMTKSYAEELLQDRLIKAKRLTKAQVRDLPNFMDYLDDQFWDDVNEGLGAALMEWVEEDTNEEEG